MMDYSREPRECLVASACHLVAASHILTRVRLTSDIASRFARLALGHVTRPWPYVAAHVMTGPEDVPRAPQVERPVFHGSYDWHSCVHGHWLLARVLRRLPDLPEASEIAELLDRQFTSEKIAGELAFLQRPSSKSFERPYGWAWLLMLAGELTQHSHPRAARWSDAIAPLASEFVARFNEFLPRAIYPVRAGAHGNTAFALLLAMQCASDVADSQFAELCSATARRWYTNDRACQAWEPCLNDFLSPALIEAACMRSALGEDDFRAWFKEFLPNAHEGEPATLFTPAQVTDRTDGQIAHLDGLNLSRAWCWRIIAGALVEDDPLRDRIERAIVAHLDASLPHLADHYAGEHWLATFALLAMDVIE